MFAGSRRLRERLVDSTLADDGRPRERLGIMRWSARFPAVELGISFALVARIWRKWGIQPHGMLISFAAGGAAGSFSPHTTGSLQIQQARPGAGVIFSNAAHRHVTSCGWVACCLARSRRGRR